MKKVGVLFRYDKDMVDVLYALAVLDSERLGEWQSLAHELHSAILVYIESRAGDMPVLEGIIKRNRSTGCQCYKCSGIIRINPLSQSSAVFFNLRLDEFEILRAMTDLDVQEDGPESISDQIHNAIRFYITSRSGDRPRVDVIIRKWREESEDRLRKLLKPRP